jgi:hypothetical protein
LNQVLTGYKLKIKMKKTKITEKIKSFEDACAHLIIEPAIPQVDGLHPDMQKAIIAFYKLSIIIMALNEGWKPDWLNYNERKWFNRFYFSSADPVFVFTLIAASSASAIIGSRLCFKTEELADYAAKNFKGLYEDYLLFN